MPSSSFSTCGLNGFSCCRETVAFSVDVTGCGFGEMGGDVLARVGDLDGGERIAFLLAKDLGFAMARKSSSDESESSLAPSSLSGGGDLRNFFVRGTVSSAASFEGSGMLAFLDGELASELRLDEGEAKLRDCVGVQRSPGQRAQCL
ncbi:hypothetical protein BN1708_000928 [Verticillium longisporum]|uniref:Uncharacterized protein n=2 Tax=Verticillium longisporum TaxID=100787 RepID=A0A0G4M7W9_VERLO|nr:hypothetical protein BN1708_000928 [Verticillium longisporum]